MVRVLGDSFQLQLVFGHAEGRAGEEVLDIQLTHTAVFVLSIHPPLESRIPILFVVKDVFRLHVSSSIASVGLDQIGGVL